MVYCYLSNLPPCEYNMVFSCKFILKTNNMFTLQPCHNFSIMYRYSSNLGIILLRIINSKFLYRLSFTFLFCNSNHPTSPLVLIKHVYQTTFSYYIITIREKPSITRSLMIKECMVVSVVSIQNVIQPVLRYGVHNWTRIDQNSYDE